MKMKKKDEDLSTNQSMNNSRIYLNSEDSHLNRYKYDFDHKEGLNMEVLPIYPKKV